MLGLGKSALAVCVLSFIIAPPLYAEQKDPSKQFKQVQKELKSKKAELKKTIKKEEKTLDEIDNTNKKLNTVYKELTHYKRKIEATKKEADTVTSELDKLKKNIAQRKDWLRQKLRTMYMYGDSGDKLLVLASSDNLSEAVRRLKYLEALSRNDRMLIEDIRGDIYKLDSKNHELNGIYERLRDQEAKTKKSEKELAKEKKAKENLLASLREKKSEYKKMVGELEAASKKLQELIDRTDSASYEGSGDFRKLKGRLLWPADGRVAVEFGSQVDPEFKTPVFRNGIYIATKDNEAVRAAQNGKVAYAEWFKGYGQLVILNHGGGYHTLYANLSEIFLKAGDIINKGDEIGRVGISGLVNGPSLYFEVRYKGKALDPLQWLESKRR